MKHTVLHLTVLALCACLPAAQTTWILPATTLSLVVNNQSAEIPQIALSPNGTALAVWSRYNGTNAVLEAARFANSAWSDLGAFTPVGRGLDADEPRIVTDGAGITTAIWTHYVNFNKMVASARLPKGSITWQMLPDLTTGGTACEPQIALDTAGNAVAVWQRYNGTSSVIESAMLPAGASSWASATALTPTISGNDSFSPQLALNGSGAAITVWTQYGGISTTIEASSRSSAGNWSRLPSLTDGSLNVDDDLPQAGIDGNGNATILWLRDNGNNRSVFTAKLASNTTSWNAMAALTSSGNASDPTIALNAAGVAMAAWARDTGSATVVEVARQQPGKSWSQPAALTSSGKAWETRLALDAKGNAFATWVRDKGSCSVTESACFASAKQSWSSVTALSRAVAHQNSWDPVIALASDGTAVAAWQRFNGTTNVIETARFDMITSLPPQLSLHAMPGVPNKRPSAPRRFRAKVVKARGKKRHQLSFTPVRDKSIAVYKLYKNGVHIATQRASNKPSLIVPFRTAAKNYYYTLTAVDKLGRESAPAKVTCKATQK